MAREQARRIINERGLAAQMEAERERILADAEQEAERIRNEADVYVRGVLADLSNRLTKIQASVSNGIEALNPPEEE
jgi:F0F1-type ATP synthase membrane subunit b/b'